MAPLATPVESPVCSAPALAVPVVEVTNVEGVDAVFDGSVVVVADRSLAVVVVSAVCWPRPVVCVKSLSNDSARSDTALPSWRPNVAVVT